MPYPIKVALHYHINLNHASMEPWQRKRYLLRDLPQLIDTISVPTNVSICAEDLLFIYQFHFSIYEKIVRSTFIKIVPSLYSHALIERLPLKVLRSQLRLASTIYSRLIPRAKITSIGYPPELAMPSKEQRKIIASYWRGVVVSNHRLHKQSESITHHIVSDQQLHYVVEHRKSEFRTNYHMFMRGQLPPESVVDGLLHDGGIQENDDMIFARIDMEVPTLNCVRLDSGKLLAGRTDLHVKLHQLFAESKQLDFIFLDDKFINETAVRQDTSIWQNEPQPCLKWHRTELENLLSKFFDDSRGLIANNPIYLSALCSDYLCVDDKEVNKTGIYRGHEGSIIIQRKRIFRNKELLAKLALLEGKSISRPTKYIAEMQKLLLDLEDRNSIFK